MDKVLVSQTFECAAEINGVKVSAKRVTIDANGKVSKIEQGYFGNTPNYERPEPHFSVYTSQGKRMIRTDADIEINPSALVEQFISSIEN